MNKCSFPASRLSKYRKDCGVTLIELLIAIVILLVGMIGALEFITIAIASSMNSQKIVIAKQLAQDTLEQIFVMRDMNAIGGPPPVEDPNDSSYGKLANTSQGGIFPDSFQSIKTNNGLDQLRGTTDDAGTDDPRFIGYQIRILVRDADTACGADDPSTCPLPASGSQIKRVIVEVKFPFLRTKKTYTTRVETYVGKPPSQTRVGTAP